MKIRRPDADKARKQLERQHMAAAEREVRVLRPRSSAPAGFGAVLKMASDFEAGVAALKDAAAGPPIASDALARLQRGVEEVPVSNVAFHLGPIEGEPIDFAAALRVEDRAEAAS